MRSAFVSALVFALVCAGFLAWQVLRVWSDPGVRSGVGPWADQAHEERREPRAQRAKRGDVELEEGREALEYPINASRASDLAEGVGGSVASSGAPTGSAANKSVGLHPAATRPVRWADDVIAVRTSNGDDIGVESDASLRHLARQCEDRGDWEGAAEANERLVGAYSGTLADRAALAGVLMRLGRWVQALPHCLVIVASNPRDARAWHNAALCHQALGHLADARDAWRRVIELMPGDEEAYARQGEVFADLGQWEQAAANFRTALVLSPGEVGTALNLALAFEKLHRREDARDVLKRFLDERPRTIPVLNRLGELAWKEYQAAPEFNGRSRAEAFEYWRRSLEIDGAQEEVAQFLRDAGG